VSVYRRPLPSTNLGFLTTIMWDGREPSLASQSIDATLIHAQANAGPTTSQQQQIVNFESGIFTAQIFDNHAQDLKARGAMGGPGKLASLLPGFYVGINDPLGGNPKGLMFTSQIFDLYQPWNSISGGGPLNAARESVARGEALFNNTSINITRVAGLNDVLNTETISGFCGTCHDTPDVGKPFGEISNKHRHRERRPEQRQSGLGHRRSADLHFVMCVRTECRQHLHCHRSRPGVDHWQMRRYRQGQGTNSTRVGRAGAVFPQWLGRNVAGCGEFLRSALHHWVHRCAEGRPRRLPTDFVTAKPK
jgi:hypothetical protein